MGPFALMDLIGHDVNFAVTRSVYDGMSQDARYKPSLVQEELVNAGLLGRKSGRGFYDYRQGRAASSCRPIARPVRSPAKLWSRAILDLQQFWSDWHETLASPCASARARGSSGSTARPWRSLTVGPPLNGMASDSSTDVLFDSGARLCDGLTHGDRARGPGRRRRQSREAAGFFQALGKTVSVIDDAPGLVVMRTVAMLANEAADVVHQGVASAVDVDVSMLKGVNYPRGPLAWADAVGPARIPGDRRSRARIWRGSLPDLAVASPPGPDRLPFHNSNRA